MKYLRLYESFNEKEINKLCKKYSINDYTINPDGSIDVEGGVNINKSISNKLPLKFNKVNRYFMCADINLISLEGSPKELNFGFYCEYNELKSFEYSPRIIRGNFYCENNHIETFEYFPTFIGGTFLCNGNPIFEVWKLFEDWTKIELLNDYDIFRDEDTDQPAIVMDRLNDFLLEIGKDPVKIVKRYKNI